MMPDYPVGTGAKLKLAKAEFHLKDLQKQVNSGKETSMQDVQQS